MRFNGLENREAPAAEHFQVNSEFAFDLLRERQALFEQNARPADQILHQCDVVVAEAAGHDVVFADTVVNGNVERNVNAAFFQVARNVLPEIRQLKRGAGCVGKLLAKRIAVAAEIEDEATDGIRGIDAIVEDRLPSGVTLDGLILPEGFEQIGEWLTWKVFCK